MDAPTTHDFSTTDFSFLPSTDADQFLQFPPNSPNSHLFSFSEAPMPTYPSYGYGPSAPAAVPACGVMDTTSSTPLPRGVTSRTVANRAGHKRRSIDAIRMADKDLHGSNSESKLGGINISTDAVVPRRCEEFRRQCVESEQHRRNDLCEAFARLKDILPVSNQKGSKMALLNRAPSHIHYLEAMHQQIQAKLAASKMEVNRLRQVNEALMLKAAERCTSPA